MKTIEKVSKIRRLIGRRR